MPNYEMCGLSSADFARIAGSVQEAPVRMRFLKPRAHALPVTGTTNIDKIDDGTHHPAPSTVITDYEKVVVDDHAGRNRTIVLHSVNLDDADAVVSVIDHDTGIVDSINKNTSSGWSADYFFYQKRDMDFNPETNELAIMVKRQTGGAAASLFVINLNKYSQELTACNQLAPEPQYLNCTIMEHAPPFAGLLGYGMHFVRHYKNRWYCWIGAFTGGNIGRADFGYFTSSGTWVSIWVQHHVETDYMDSPRFKPPSPLPPLGEGAYGDPMCVLAIPKTMEIDDGMLTLGLDAAYNTAYFGNELSIVRADLETLTNMGDITTGIIETVDIEHRFEGSVTTGIKASETISLGASDACIYEVIVTAAWSGTGTASPAEYTRFYVETDTGAVVWATDERFFIFSTDGSVTVGLAAFNDFTISGGDGHRTMTAQLEFRKFPNSLTETLGVHSETPIAATTDAIRPAVGDPEFTGGPQRALMVDDSAATTTPTACFYSAASGTYAFSADSGGGVHQGLMQIRAGGTNFTHYMEADGLYDDYVRALKPIGSDTFLVVSGFVSPDLNNVAQIFNADKNTLTAVNDSYTMTYQSGVTKSTVSVGYSPVYSSVTLVTENEVWIFKPDTPAGVKWSRNIRIHWDGSQPDKDYYVSGDSLKIVDLKFSDGRGLASATCSFTARGDGFLPWKKSTENEDLNNPGAYSALLTYGTRVQIQRGIKQADGTWNWIDEAQVVVTELPENLERGMVNIPVQCEGLAAHLFTKAIYEWFHEPTRVHATPAVTLHEITANDPDPPSDLKPTKDFGYYPNYVDPSNPGSRTTDWIMNPPPIVELDGTETKAYQVDSRRGIIRFAADQTGATVTADFYYYQSGTNEVEDIIWCICTHPNDVDAEMGGAGLDESYITDTRADDPLTLASDGLSATFPRDNLYSASDVEIKRDGAVWDPANYTLDLRTGAATLGSDQTGHTFTATYKHWTLQASGITAPPMQFTDRDDGTALDCIERACRATFSFNYIFKARRDGKFESDYFTQKTTADITITDSHIVLEKLVRDPADEDCYNAVISYGKYPEGELPNLALGIVPSNDWTNISGQSWGHALTLEAITDGDVATQQGGGWGGNDGYGPVRTAVVAAADGLPAFTIDLGESIEIDQIVFVRGSGRSNEGGYVGIQTQSIWGSRTSGTPADPMPAAWEQIIPPFQTPPAMTVNFHAGQDWPEGRKYQYLCVNLHDIGLYLWEHIDSQISFAEFQVYESEFIRGYAQLQDEDSGADLWDYNGLIEKHGLLTLVARDGQPDETLVTQELADADAAAILTEVSRYVVTHNLTSCPLPGVDILCTLNVTNAILNTSLNFFIENRSFGDYLDKDSLDGVYVP